MWGTLHVLSNDDESPRRTLRGNRSRRTVFALAQKDAESAAAAVDSVEHGQQVRVIQRATNRAEHALAQIESGHRSQMDFEI